MRSSGTWMCPRRRFHLTFRAGWRFTSTTKRPRPLPHPVMCEKIRYYQDPYFKARLLPKIGIPMLSV